ncbi:MAG: hypothetical protein AVDCRST_MAG30-1281, partial [uncultured Solirubrobacteraceae bacterium]
GDAHEPHQLWGPAARRHRSSRAPRPPRTPGQSVHRDPRQPRERARRTRNRCETARRLRTGSHQVAHRGPLAHDVV